MLRFRVNAEIKMRTMRSFAHESEEVFAFGSDEMKVAIHVLTWESQACVFATASADLTENKSRCKLTTPLLHPLLVETGLARA